MRDPGCPVEATRRCYSRVPNWVGEERITGSRVFFHLRERTPKAASSFLLHTFGIMRLAAALSLSLLAGASGRKRWWENAEPDDTLGCGKCKVAVMRLLVPFPKVAPALRDHLSRLSLAQPALRDAPRTFAGGTASAANRLACLSRPAPAAGVRAALALMVRSSRARRRIGQRRRTARASSHQR